MKLYKSEKETLINTLKIMYIFSSLCFVDVWLRVLTRYISLYSIYAFEPNMFTICWGIFFLVVLSMFSIKIGRIIYFFIYFISAVYVIIQYGYYLIFNKFLFLQDFLYVGEGSEYLSYVKSLVNINIVVKILLLAIIGIVGIIIFPDFKEIKNRKIKRIVLSFLFIIGIVCIPYSYKEDEGLYTNRPKYEYEYFSNSTFDMQITGSYQYVARDLQLLIQKKTKDYSSYYEVIDKYFANKNEHLENSMTGIFEGKNLIYIMMESMDDWLVSEETTPTIYSMMENGINFENFYTPQYSSGYTFNTEFASNTSIYPYSNGNASYSLSKNKFSKSMASLFREKGYTSESFHQNTAQYYNRGEIHKAMGYENYNSYREFDFDEIPVNDDLYLIQCEELFEKLVRKEHEKPFFLM